MTNGPDLPQPQLEPFHVCIHCGSVFRREECSGRAINSGIYHCAKCGRDGPLNIEIREVEDPARGRDTPADASLSSQG